jgi:hypothetical protein
VVHTSGHLSTVGSIHTQVTLLHHIFSGQKLRRTKGTGLETELTTRAFLLVDENNAIGAFADRILRAGLNAGRLAAVLTGHGHKIHGQLTPNSGGSYLMDLNEVCSHSEPMLLFARHLAGKTPITEIHVHKQ